MKTSILAILLAFPAVSRALELPKTGAFAELQILVPAADHPAPQEIAAQPFNDASIELALAGEGVAGLIHGSVADARQYVLAVHNPESFFDYRLYPLRLSRQQLEAVEAAAPKRHDFVRVKGRLVGDPPHIRVEELTVEERYAVDFSRQTLEKPALVDPAEFAQGPKRVVALVHGVLRGGHQVALEYRDGILPLTLDDETDEATASVLNKLWRGDIVELTVGLRGRPGAPPHLVLIAASGVSVLDSVRALQDKSFTAEGPLVLFTRSPITNLDVFAVQVRYPEWGVTRNFTVSNFRDPGVWQAGNVKLAAAWTAAIATARQGRNKFINPGLIVRVTGTLAVLTPDKSLAQNQANQNIQYSSPAAIELVSRP